MFVSVVIPIYNVENYLRKCLDSVCVQDGCVKEIILVNDGSTDGSLAICREYAQKDRRIKIIDKQNEGASAAVIDGVNEATCEYVGFVDSDDYIEPNMFRELYNGMVDHDADIVICDYDDADESGNRSGRRDFGIGYAGLHVKTDGKFDMPLTPKLCDKRYVTGMRWNKLYKRELLVNNIAFKKTDIRIGEDMALVLPVLMSASRVVYVKECLYHYVQRSGSIVHNYKRKNVADWQSANEILLDAAKEYDYKLEEFDDSRLCFLWQNCLRHVRRSDLTRSQKRAEYKYIGEFPSVARLLKTAKIVGSLKTRLTFKLLKYKLYGILALK